MKIGVFDSGLGGIVITQAFKKSMPEYDFVYYGDTKNLPYGDKSPQQILEYSIKAVDFLVTKNAKIIIIACNTASAIALRWIQQVVLPQKYPDIKVLGVVIPTLEEALLMKGKRIGIIATSATVKSQVYSMELKKLAPNLTIKEVAAPELVPAIESNNMKKALEIVKKYTQELTKIDTLILGCTHYVFIKDMFQECLPNVNILSSGDFMGRKLNEYLLKHNEIEVCLEKSASIEVFVSEKTDEYQKFLSQVFPEVKIVELVK